MRSESMKMPAKSFVQIPDGSGFGLENLPYGVFSTNDNAKKRIGVAIGLEILDLSVISHLFNGPFLSSQQHVFKQVYIWCIMKFKGEFGGIFECLYGFGTISLVGSQTHNPIVAFRGQFITPG